MTGISFDPGPENTCALCGRELPENVRANLISAQYLTCNMDRTPDAPRHTGEELRAYFAEHGVSFR
jgi:hypothetical protein